MNDESEPVTAIAKAVEETAKTGRALVEAGSNLANFVGKALGTVPEDTVGLLDGGGMSEAGAKPDVLRAWPERGKVAK